MKDKNNSRGHGFGVGRTIIGFGRRRIKSNGRRKIRK